MLFTFIESLIALLVILLIVSKGMNIIYQFKKRQIIELNPKQSKSLKSINFYELGCY